MVVLVKAQTNTKMIFIKHCHFKVRKYLLTRHSSMLMNIIIILCIFNSTLCKLIKVFLTTNKRGPKKGYMKGR